MVLKDAHAQRTVTSFFQGSSPIVGLPRKPLVPDPCPPGLLQRGGCLSQGPLERGSTGYSALGSQSTAHQGQGSTQFLGSFCFPSNPFHRRATCLPPTPACDLVVAPPPGPTPIPRSSSFTVRASFSASSLSFFSSSLECFSSALAPAPMVPAAGEQSGWLVLLDGGDPQSRARRAQVSQHPSDPRTGNRLAFQRPVQAWWGCLVGFGGQGFPRANERQGQVKPAQPPALLIRLAWPQSLSC